MLRPLAVAVVALLSCETATAESWLCVGDQGTGFEFKNGKWRSVIYKNADTLKIVIRTPTASDREFLKRPNILDDPNPKWLAVPLGEEFPTMACNENGNPDFVNCEGAIQELRFNKSSLRFQYTYRPGYIDSKAGSDDNGDEPKMAIGRCSMI